MTKKQFNAFFLLLHVFFVGNVSAAQKPGGLAAARTKEQSSKVKRREVSESRKIAARQSLKKEREKEAKRYEVDSRPLEEIIESKESDRFTQSEAHMHLAEMRNLINDNYNVAPYLNVISTIIANEAKYKNTHYAFYHTTPNAFRLLQDLYTELYAATHPEEKIDDRFKFLRFDKKTVSSTAQGWLLNEIKEKGLVDDNSEDSRAILLSVNLALFGNVGFPGECSWDYFMTPKGHFIPGREMYEAMMEQFGLTDQYIDEIMGLLDVYNTKEDTLIQILVPIEKLDQIAYLAWVKGIPAHQEIIDLIKTTAKGLRYETQVKPTMEKLTERFAEEQTKNPLYVDLMNSVEAGDFSLEAFLKIYRNKPWDLPNINDVTGRLLFTPEVLFNPASNVKFFRFGTAHRDKLKEYREKLHAIVDKLIAEKEAREVAEEEK